MQKKKKMKLDPDCMEEDDDLMDNTEDDQDQDEDENEDTDQDQDQDEDEDDEEELLSNRPKMKYWSPRMELFSVRVKLYDGESLENVFGSITVVDPTSLLEIFHSKTGVYYESTAYPGWSQLLLTGPNRHIEADDYSCVLMRLTKDIRDMAIEGRKWDLPRLWKGITWDNMRDRSTFYANQHLYACIGLNFGKLLMDYALLSCAQGAIVKVEFVNINNDDASANVYGTITARTTDFKGCERVLFRKTHLEAEKVKSGDLIPLTRNSVCGSFRSRLVIRLDLWNHSDIHCVDNVDSSRFKSEKIDVDENPCVDNDEVVVNDQVVVVSRSKSEKTGKDEDHSVISCSNSEKIIVAARFRSEKIKQGFQTEQKSFSGSFGKINVTVRWKAH